MRTYLIAIAAMLLPQSIHAEATKTQFTAPNGVIVNVNADDFAGRREFSAPAIDFKADGGATGKAIVGEVFSDGKLLGLTIQGFIIYFGDWRHYSSAIFKGGAAAEYHRTGSKVGDCTGVCTLSEEFMIDITPAEATSHAENGVLQVQLRAENGSTALISIPLSYIQAVEQVAH